MLTYEDCLATCRLTEEEIEAIAEHEHIPEIVAMELGDTLARTGDGVPCIRRFILDDIAAARARGDEAHARALRVVLRRFVADHPVPPGAVRL